MFSGCSCWENSVVIEVITFFWMGGFMICPWCFLPLWFSIKFSEASQEKDSHNNILRYFTLYIYIYIYNVHYITCTHTLIDIFFTFKVIWLLKLEDFWKLISFKPHVSDWQSYNSLSFNHYSQVRSRTKSPEIGIPTHQFSLFDLMFAFHIFPFKSFLLFFFFSFSTFPSALSYHFQVRNY